MADITRITENSSDTPPAGYEYVPTSDIALFDDAIPLVRDDQPWQWFALFLDPDETPSDLTGLAITAEIRWATGRQEVTVAPVDAANGHISLSLTAEQTHPLPFGRLSRLFIAVGTDTEARIPINVLEGKFTT